MVTQNNPLGWVSQIFWDTKKPNPKRKKIQNKCAYWIELVRAKKLLMATPNGFVFPMWGLCLLLEMGL